MLFSLRCLHDNRHDYAGQRSVTLFPNFQRHNNQNFFTHDSLHYGKYVYLGGHIAVERSIIDQYTSEIIYHRVTMMGYANTMNQEASNTGRSQLTPIDRRVLMDIIQSYLLLQFDLSMGNALVSAPCQMKDFDLWAWKQFPRLLSCFIYLWTNHSTLIAPCGSHCSQCLVVDGHQKCRRRICAFKDVTVDTDEMTGLLIGCCRTPAISSRFCDKHRYMSIQGDRSREKNPQQERVIKRLHRYDSRKSQRKNDRLNLTSCRTRKAHSDGYIKKCTRSFGLIALVYNCRIITSFSELFRSESIREIINLFSTSIRGMLCHAF
jgi:hypothetical protein